MKNFYTLLLAWLVLGTCQAWAQVPKLNSYAASPAVIFLDADGHTVNGTSWNSNGPITLAPASLDNNRIAEIFNRVAEDFRPFNINITTDSAKYWAAPANRRMRVILTPTYEWYGAAGGVAFMFSFTWGDNTPCFVFTSLLGNNAKNIAEAVSHEAGHTLGLNHQASYDNCVKVSEYNSGVGAGETSWAPIMGVGYSRNLTQWNNGANPTGCTNYQDDLGIITGLNNGFGYRMDDHANTIVTATPAEFANNKFSIGGLIERNDDIDILRVNIPVKGKLSVVAKPYAVANGNSGSNIDLQIELLNSLGTVIGRYNPPGNLDVMFDTTLNAGNYYLRIAGSGNDYASPYASLGSYGVEGNYAALTTLPLHKLELKGIADNGQHKLSWEVIADENIVSQTVEVSTDGTSFRTLASTAVAQRSYQHQATAAGNHFYRMNLRFDDGRQYYSNVIVLKSEARTGKPLLVGNSVRSELRVSSPGSGNYAILDLNGRLLQRGVLNAGLNNLSLPAGPSGMYLAQFQVNGHHYTERFMKQ